MNEHKETKRASTRGKEAEHVSLLAVRTYPYRDDIKKHPITRAKVKIAAAGAKGTDMLLISSCNQQNLFESDC